MQNLTYIIADVNVFEYVYSEHKLMKSSLMLINVITTDTFW